MKKLFIVLLSLGILFMFSCGDEGVNTEDKIFIGEPQVNNEAPAAPPFNHPSRGLTEEIYVPVQRIVPKVGAAQSILRDGSPPELYIAAFKMHPGPRGEVRIHLFVGRGKNNFVYANYPVIVKAHPSIHIYRGPSAYPWGSDTKLYYTGHDGQMVLEARSQTGESQPIYFNVGPTKYKVFLGDS